MRLRFIPQNFFISEFRFLGLINSSLLSFMFTGTASGLAIAMVGGFVISVYLYYSPPHLPKQTRDEHKEFNGFNENENYKFVRCLLGLPNNYEFLLNHNLNLKSDFFCFFQYV